MKDRIGNWDVDNCGVNDHEHQYNSPLNLSLSQQENSQTLGAARFKPSARFIHEKTKRYMKYRNVIYNPSNIQLQRTRSQANWNGAVEQQLGEKPPRTSTCT